MSLIITTPLFTGTHRGYQPVYPIPCMRFVLLQHSSHIENIQRIWTQSSLSNQSYYKSLYFPVDQGWLYPIDASILLRGVTPLFPPRIWSSIASKQQIMQYLTDWVHRGSPEEKRQEAFDRIEDFLCNPTSKRLSLSGCQLKQLPDIWAYPSFVQRLQFLGVNGGLCRGALTDIPPSFVCLEKLREIDLSRNAFSVFPEELFYLIQLKQLNFSYNSLRHLPENISNLLALRRIDFGYNCLTDIPRSLFSLKKLIYMNFACNKICFISDCFENLTQLKTLRLEGNTFRKIPDTISTLQKLEILDIRNCKELCYFPRAFFERQSVCTVLIYGISQKIKNYFCKIVFNPDYQGPLFTPPLTQRVSILYQQTLSRLVRSEDLQLEEIPATLCGKKTIEKDGKIDEEAVSLEEDDVLQDYVCAITWEIPKDPVYIDKPGRIARKFFDKTALLGWRFKQKTCPLFRDEFSWKEIQYGTDAFRVIQKRVKELKELQFFAQS